MNLSDKLRLYSKNGSAFCHMEVITIHMHILNVEFCSIITLQIHLSLVLTSSYEAHIVNIVTLTSQY